MTEDERNKSRIAEDRTQLHEKVEKLRGSKFKQQMLATFRPVTTLFQATIVYALFGIILLTIGIGLNVLNDRVHDITVQYDLQCPQPLFDTCTWVLLCNPMCQSVKYCD